MINVLAIDEEVQDFREVDERRDNLLSGHWTLIVHLDDREFLFNEWTHGVARSATRSIIFPSGREVHDRES